MPKYAYSGRNDFENGLPLSHADSREEAIEEALQEGGEVGWIAPITEVLMIPPLPEARLLFCEASDYAMAPSDHGDKLTEEDFAQLQARLQPLYSQVNEVFQAWVQEHGLAIYEIGEPEEVSAASLGPKLDITVKLQDKAQILVKYKCEACGTVLQESEASVHACSAGDEPLEKKVACG